MYVVPKCTTETLHNGKRLCRYSSVLGHFVDNCIYDLAKHPSRARYIISERNRNLSRGRGETKSRERARVRVEPEIARERREKRLERRLGT